MVLTDKMLKRVQAIINGIESGKIKPVQVSGQHSKIEAREISKSILIIEFLARNKVSAGEICMILKEEHLPYANFNNVSKILEAARIKPVKEKPGPPKGKKFRTFLGGGKHQSLLSSSFPACRRLRGRR